MKRSLIGIDLGGTRIKIGLVGDNKMIQSRIIAADSEGLLNNLGPIGDEINSLIREFSEYNVAGIGLGFPGLVDPVSKRILSTNKKFDDAPRVDLSNWVKRNWNVPFCLDNDARMAALGEWKHGAAADTDNFVSITIGTGVGTAVMMEGKLLRGKHFQAGILGGHISVDYHGRNCTCGSVGCLEAYASTWSIKERIIQHPGYRESLLSSMKVLDFQTLFAVAKQRDALALEFRQDCLDAWTAGIVNLVHAYDPDAVVIGGGVMNNHEEILPYVSEKVNRLAWTPWGNVDIRRSTLLGDAGTFGAAHAVALQLENE
jgi:glucokinase